MPPIPLPHLPPTPRAALPAGVAPKMLANPFYTMTRGIHKSESIAFAVVYALTLGLYAVRLLRRPKYGFVWRFLALFCAFRVVAFVVRYYVAATSPAASNFMALLIVNGVMIVAGFIFLAEAVLAMLFQYFCALRGVSGEGHWKVAAARHATIAGISVIGIAGAVLQITSVNKLDMGGFETAKKLRQASGALFIVVSLWAMLAPVAISVMTWTPGNPRIRNKLLPAAILSVAGMCLLLESAYRVVSATHITGWITTEKAVDVLIFMPELIILVMFLAADFDSFERISLCNPFTLTPSTPYGSHSDSDEESVISTEHWKHKISASERAHWESNFSDLERQQSLGDLHRAHTNTSYGDMLERPRPGAVVKEKQNPAPSLKQPTPEAARSARNKNANDHWTNRFTPLERQRWLHDVRTKRGVVLYPPTPAPGTGIRTGGGRTTPPRCPNAGHAPALLDKFTPLERQASLRDLHTKRASVVYDPPATPRSVHSTHSRAASRDAGVGVGIDDIGAQNRFSQLERQASLRDLHTKRASVNYDALETELGHRRSLSDVLKATIYDPAVGAGGIASGTATEDDIGVQNKFTPLERKRSLNDVRHKRASVNYGLDPVLVDPPSVPPPASPPAHAPATGPSPEKEKQHPPEPPSASPSGLLGAFSPLERKLSLNAIRRTRTNSHYGDMLERKCPPSL